MTVGASNTSGEREPLFSRSMKAQSNNIAEGLVLCHSLLAGDNLAVDVPNGALVLLGGRAFAGICQTAGTVSLPQDIDTLAQKAGIAKAQLKANTACTAGGVAGYAPADGGTVQPVTSANAGALVAIGRFTQSKASSSSAQMVGVELYAHGDSGGEKLLGAIVATSTAITTTTVETAFSQSVPIPAGRILTAGTVLRIRAKANITSGNSTDTLTLKCRLNTAAGVLLGSTPAVDVTNGGGDLGTLDLVATVRTVGASGTMTVAGMGGISPGAAVATGGNTQSTGTASTIALDTTILNTVVITATWSASSASDSVVLEDLSVSISG